MIFLNTFLNIAHLFGIWPLLEEGGELVCMSLNRTGAATYCEYLSKSIHSSKSRGVNIFHDGEFFSLSHHFLYCLSPPPLFSAGQITGAARQGPLPTVNTSVKYIPRGVNIFFPDGVFSHLFLYYPHHFSPLHTSPNLHLSSFFCRTNHRV